MVCHWISLFYLSSVVFNCIAIANIVRKLRDTKQSGECGLEGQPPCSINFKIPSPYLNQKNESFNNFQIFQAPVNFNLYFDGKNRSKLTWPKIEAESPQKSGRNLIPLKAKSGNPAAASEIKSNGETFSESDKSSNSYIMGMYAQLMTLKEADKEIKRKIDNLSLKIVLENGKLPEEHNSIVSKRFAGNNSDTKAKNTILRSKTTNGTHVNQQLRNRHSKKVKN